MILIADMEEESAKAEDTVLTMTEAFKRRRLWMSTHQECVHAECVHAECVHASTTRVPMYLFAFPSRPSLNIWHTDMLTESMVEIVRVCDGPPNPIVRQNTSSYHIGALGGAGYALARSGVFVDPSSTQKWLSSCVEFSYAQTLHAF